MFNKINGLKYAPIVVATLLVACGGGGGDSGGGSTAQMNNTVSLSGTVEVEPGKNLPLESRVSVLRSSVATHAWTISQVNGDPAIAANSPTIVDKDCATATKKPGAASTSTTVGVTGSSACLTSLVVPSTAKPGEWTIRNAATATDGNSASGTFTLKILAKPASTNGFSLIIPNTPQIQELNKLAKLSASYVVNPGVTVDSVSYLWTQVSGEAVTLSAPKTATPSFLAKTSGEYVFRVSATITVNGKTEVQEGDIVVSVAQAEAVTYFDVEAGDVQVGKIGEPVSLVGKVAGNAAAGTLTYEWTQVSGPQQVLFANEKSLNASFIPQVSGTYVFQLKVSNATGFKTATTTVAIDAAQSTTPFFIVSAGDAQLADAGTVVTLKGEVAAGTPPPSNITYLWEQTSGLPITLSNSTSLQATFIPSAAGHYEFRLTASSNGVVKTSTTVVSVKAIAIVTPTPTPATGGTTGGSPIVVGPTSSTTGFTLPPI